MLKISQKSVVKSLKLISQNSAKIVSHRKENGIVIFNYNIDISVDTKESEKISGNVKLRVLRSRQSEKKINISKSTFFSKNIFKGINQQKLSQRNQIIQSRNYLVEKNIDRSSLGQKSITVDFELESGKINDTFYVEIVSVGESGSIQVISSFEINHKSCLEKYDLPGDEFSIAVAQSGNDEIVISAFTEDDKIGGFRFFVKNDSGFTFENARFYQAAEAGVENSKIATARINVRNNEMRHIIRATPISTFLAQQIGNFKETVSSYVKSSKKIPFYMTSLKDTSVTFSIGKIDSSIRQIFLYKQSATSLEREFIASISSKNKSLQGFTMTDKYRNPYYDFIYTADYQDSAGTIIASAGEVYVPALRLDKIAKINVQKVRDANQKTATKIQAGAKKSVSFNVKVEYDLSTPFDQIVEDIKALNLYDTFSQDLEKMTNNLKPLTRVLVSRISFLTGDEEYLGAYPAGIITVPNYEGEKSIYRFEVAVRSAPESLENIAASQSALADNAFNNKNFSDMTSKLIGNKFNSNNSNFTSKFLSRSSINQSTLKYGNSSDINSLSYYEGRTGIFADATVSYSGYTPPTISGIQTITNDTGNYVKWIVKGDIKKISEFKISIDGEDFFCMPSLASVQMFYIGNVSSKKVTVLPIFYETGSDFSDVEIQGAL